MRLRHVLYTALATGLLATTAVAVAAPKGGCAPVITSERGGPATLDLRSADLAMGRTELVAVLRVTSTRTSQEPLTLFGARWDFGFQIGSIDHHFSLNRSTGPTGSRDDARAIVSGVSVPVVATVDATTITWKVPRSALPVFMKPQAKKAAMEVYAASSALSATAESESGTAYWHGNRACGGR